MINNIGRNGFIWMLAPKSFHAIVKLFPIVNTIRIKHHAR